VIDVRGLIGAIPTTTVTVRTFGASSVNMRGETLATPSDEARALVVHPAGRRQIERLPEADRQRETIAIYDVAEDSPLVPVPTRKAPRVIYQGDTYEVTFVGDYAEMGGVHLVLASRIDGVTA